MLKRMPNILLYVIVSTLLACALSLVIAYVFNYNFFDVTFWVGLGIIALGGMSSVAGNATGSRLFGGSASQYESFANIETLQMERKSTKYYETFKQHAVFDPKVSGISIIFSGILLVIITCFLT